ncbi:MAG: DUF2341 domain-containing protein, partial [Nanoarchaeota archaeon]|nr:DUF2341 domain-containing protein [Nanoarchaeota archaeon]
MSGFGNVIGYMMSFAILAFLFVSVFYMYESELVDRVEGLDLLEKESLAKGHLDYAVSNPYMMSGRVNFLMNNSGRAKFYFRDGENDECFNIFSANDFFSEDSLKTHLLDKSLAYDYRFLDIGGYGQLLYKDVVSSGENKTVKFISCGGIEKYFELVYEDLDWWDSTWLERKKITVNDSSGSDLVEYQIELDFNSSNLDFAAVKESEIRFILDLKENLMLDLPFDDYIQVLNDYSKNSNFVSLGLSSSSGGDDPSSISGVIFDALSFDGVDDLLNVSFNSSLQSSKGLTYASWVKWDSSGGNELVIFSNGGNGNSLRMINDGGANDANVLFQLNVSGVVRSLYSGVAMDENWHFLSASYDGFQMKLYIDSVLISNLTAIGNIVVGNDNNYIGKEASGNFYKGYLDEFKAFNLPLSDGEVEDLYYNNLRFRELDFYVSQWSSLNQNAKLFVKVPSILSNSYVDFYMYYDNREGVLGSSDMESTFSYLAPRDVGYVVSELTADTNGLNIFSLYDSNIIVVDTDVFSLDELEGTTLAAASVGIDDLVKMRYLAQVEGQDLSGGEMIVPISWAGTNFYYRGMRNNPDTICIMSPFGNANVDILEDGVSLWSGVVGSNTYCNNTLNLGTGSNLGIEADIPVLAAYYGDVSDDAFSLRPATNDDLFGVPSGALYVGVGASGASGTVYESDGSSSVLAAGAYGTYADTGPAGEGDTPAFRLESDGLLGAIQQGDGDGAETTVLASFYDMGIKYGSRTAVEYVVAASLFSDANCSMYDSFGALFENIYLGTGSEVVGVYNYSFGIIDNAQYLPANWKLECDKPVWPYYESTSEDETNLFGHLQMRQYVYP